MTATNPQTAPNSAQMILADTATLKRDLTTILDLARATDRLLGRVPAPNGLEKLEQDVAAARADLIAAERAAASADGNLARAEKAESVERGQRLAEMETQRRAGLERLAEIVMAQRIVRLFPAITYSGPAFVAWAGGKIERKRRGLHNPNARNIWGIPLDFG